MKTFAEYDDAATSTNRYSLDLPPAVYYALGIAGESGELVDKIKKMWRDHDGKHETERSIAIALELGDVLWYVSQMAQEFGFELADIAQMNIEKLAGREKRGTLGGSGDER
jgi:NTP pyrophosphatase (non-canonical NTP hydrolase)